MRKFMMELESDERAEIVAAVKEISVQGLRAARHLSGDLYEVRADTNGKFFRLIFAAEGRYSQVLLAACPRGLREEEQEDPDGQVGSRGQATERLAISLDRRSIANISEMR